MTRLYSFLVLIFVLTVSGCLYDAPPTGPSRSNNTWLLGVWEYHTTEGHSRKAIVTPLDSDRVTIIYQELDANKKKVQAGTFTGWISKVGQASLLTIAIPQEGNLGKNSYLLLGYQLLNPMNVRLREVTLDPSAQTASAYQLRKLIRRSFRDGTIFSGKYEIWKKTGEVFWNPQGNPAEDTFSPIRNVRPLPPSSKAKQKEDDKYNPPL